MADNFLINLGAGGPSIRSEDLGAGVQAPVAKIHTGASGTDGGAATFTNPFPTANGIAPIKVFNAISANATSATFNLVATHNNASLQVILAGSVVYVGGTVMLQGSLDGTNFDAAGLVTWTIGSDTNKAMKFSVDKPFAAFQLVAAGLTGGTSPTLTAWVGAS